MRCTMVGMAILVFFLSLAPSRPISAADSGRGDLPPGMPFGISIRSANALLAAADNFVAAASVGTAGEVPPGGFAALAHNIIPYLALKTWDQDRDAQVFVHGDLSNGARLACVVAVPDFPAFIEEVSARYRPATRDDANDCHRVVMPSVGPLVAAPLGEGRAVVASEPECLELVRAAWTSGWRPRHWANGVAGAALVPPDGWRASNRYLGNLDTILTIGIASLEQMRDNLIASASRSPSSDDDDIDQQTIDLALGILDALHAYSPTIIRELDGIRRVDLNLDVKEQSVVAKLTMTSEAQTIVGRIASLADRRDNLAPIPIGEFANSAEVLLFNASAESILPDVANDVEHIASLIMGRYLPDFKVPFSSLCGNFVRRNLDKSAIALHNTKLGRLLLIRTPSLEPAESQETLLALLRVINDIENRLQTAGGDPHLQFSISETQTQSGMQYTRVGFTQESIVKVLATLPDSDLKSQAKEILRNFAAFSKAGDSSYSIAVGNNTGETLLSSFEKFVMYPQNKDATNNISGYLHSVSSPRQILLALFRIDYFDDVMLAIAQTRLGLYDMFAQTSPPQLVSNSTIPVFFEKARQQFRRSDGLTLLSIGGVNSDLTAELRLSLDSINTVYGNWQLFKTELRQAMPEKKTKQNFDDDDASIFGDEGGF